MSHADCPTSDHTLDTDTILSIANCLRSNQLTFYAGTRQNRRYTQLRQELQIRGVRINKPTKIK